MNRKIKSGPGKCVYNLRITMVFTVSLSYFDFRQYGQKRHGKIKYLKIFSKVSTYFEPGVAACLVLHTI